MKKRKAGGEGSHFSPELKGHGCVYKGTIDPAEDFYKYT